MRCRPLSDKELNDGRKRIVDMDVEAGQVKVGVPRVGLTRAQGLGSRGRACCLPGVRGCEGSWFRLRARLPLGLRLVTALVRH